jgi:hypothetical protein
MTRVLYCPCTGLKANYQSKVIDHVNTMFSEKNEQTDRRHSDRFAIERELRYRILSKRGGEEAGDGKTINISSAGVLFTTKTMLLPGRHLELAISWPAQLNNKCALRLVARGRIVRFEEGRAAMEIQQYEFRTQAANPGAHLVTT